jgi:hypothetical protein
MKRRRRIPRAALPEKAEQASGVTLLRSICGYDAVYVIGTKRRRGDYQGTMQSPGIPDVFAYLPAPRFHPSPFPADWLIPLWWEVKAADGTLRKQQGVFREMSRRARVNHVVGTLDALIEFLVAGYWLKAENVPHYRRASRYAGGAPGSSATSAETP